MHARVIVRACAYGHGIVVRGVVSYLAMSPISSQVEEPIALKGTVCASADYDNRKGKCVPTTTSAAVQQPEEAGKQLVAEGGVVVQGKDHHHEHHGGEQQEEGEERGECPLCTYMLNSPCKDVFVVFKACIDKCVVFRPSQPTDRSIDSGAGHDQQTHTRPHLINTGPGTRTRRRT